MNLHLHHGPEDARLDHQVVVTQCIDEERHQGLGLLWSRRMVRPLEVLVGATRRVARGDLESFARAAPPTWDSIR